LRSILILLGLVSGLFSFGQNPQIQGEQIPEEAVFDSLTHSAQTAAIRSAILPGLGQAYNEKYWKIPLVYAGIGTSIYFIVDNQRQYRNFKDAYLIRTDGDSTTLDQFPQYTDANLLSLVDFHRRNRDFSAVITLLIYAFNIVDASVDAHLYGFDVSDNLSLDFRPTATPDPRSGMYLYGASLTLNF